MPATRPSRLVRALLVGVLLLDAGAAGAVIAQATRPQPPAAVATVPAPGAWGSSWSSVLATPTEPSAEPDPAERRALATLLDQRAAAALRGDTIAFLATVDRSAAAFYAAQRVLAANLTRLSLVSWRYEQRGLAPSPPPDVAARLGGSAWLARVVLRYRIAGFDSGEVTRVQYLTVVRRGGRWLLAGDTDGEVYGDATDRDLWDLAEVRVARSGPVLVIGSQPLPVLRAYAAEAAGDIPRVTEVWGAAWSRRALLIVPSTAGQLKTLLAGQVDPSGLDQIAAMTVGQLVGDASAAGADRVVINPGPYATLRPVGRQVVLTHELTHVATRAASSEDRMPLWLVEGFADYVGWRDSGVPVSVAAQELLTAVRAGRVPSALPTAAAFDAGTSDVSAAYQGSWLACRLIARRWGQAALVRLYRQVATEVGRGRTPDVALDAALRELGTSTHAFTAEWRRSLVSAAG